MPKKSPAELDVRIAAEVARHPGGIGIDALRTALGDSIARRTLQRRLHNLIDAKDLVAIGAGRARVYRAPGSVDVYARAAALESGGIVTSADIEIYVPVSPESRAVVEYVRQPAHRRTPVGYDREFLESYRPNETWYLPPELRAYLLQIGRSPDSERPAGTYARDLLGRLLIDLSWASSQLEGNTYTRLDTQNLIERGLAAAGKDRSETQMILNHKAAIEMLVEQAGDIGFNTFTFCNLHALLSENLLADPAESGRLRQRIVEIGGTTFHPLGVPQQLEEYFRLVLQKADAINNAFEQAFFVMVHLPYLQPFVDVNKRVSRLGANISLIRNNLCPLSFIDVPERAYVEGTLGVYELNRVELLRDVFVWAYERSCQRFQAIRQVVAEPDPLRMRYRETLVTLVGDIVRNRQHVSDDTVRGLAAGLVPADELSPFVRLALAELAGLHEGNIARYRLRRSEYRDWIAAPDRKAPSA